MDCGSGDPASTIHNLATETASTVSVPLLYAMAGEVRDDLSLYKVLKMSFDEKMKKSALY
jgi:hypothetical protein